jgi:HAD superfamily hydrolase (TIGR01509 family)
MATPAAVIFDNDGLLLDTESVWTRGERELFERRGLEFTVEHKRELIGTSAEECARILALRLDEPGREAALIGELDMLVFDELGHGIEPMTGALELVAALEEIGTPMAVVSNSPARFIARALDLAGAAASFGIVVSGHDVAAPKPAPDAYLEACRLLGVEPAPGVVVLEDSPTGVAAGRAAGLTVLGVPSMDGIDLSEADAVYASLTEPGLRERLGLAPRAAGL